jgi:V8-like Glu-specific endopeptidase
MKPVHALWAALAAALTLASCGGGSSSTSTNTGNAGPVPTAAELALLPLSVAAPSQFIAPLDTAALKRSTPAGAQAVSRLPAGASAVRVSLGALPAAAKSATVGRIGAPLQIGQGRDVAPTDTPAALAAQWRWQRLPDGSQVAAVAFDTADAQGVRLGVLARNVPDGTVLRFHGTSSDKVVEVSAADLAALRRLNEDSGLSGDAAAMAWGPDTDGSVATLEVQLPPGVSSDRLQLAVPRLSHLTQTVAQAIESPEKSVNQIGDGGSCNVDVMCTPYQTEGRAVAKMMFSDQGNTYLCSGTLLNDARASQTPYFLTAAHCVSTQQVASTLVTYWFFRAASCNVSPTTDPAMTRVTGGAQLLYTRASYDATLLQLNQQPPANVVYAGSYFGPGALPGIDVLGVHHPEGDLQKASVGTLRGYANCGGGDCTRTSSASSGSMLEVTWRTGVTEGGSSGSAMFAQSGGIRYVVGTLYGGASSCQNPTGSDYYGRLELSFADGIGRLLGR